MSADAETYWRNQWNRATREPDDDSLAYDRGSLKSEANLDRLLDAADERRAEARS